MSRVQLAINVDNLDESIAFYSKLFGTEAAKLKPGYANFTIAEPPLKLILMENPGQAVASTTSAWKSPIPTPSMRSRPVLRLRDLPQSTNETPPAATPSRTSSG